MELNWSTFILELINFVVLVWLLKRLFYAPVLKAIAERRKAVEQTLAEAERARAEGRSLQKEYEDRLRAWEREKEARQLELEHAMEDQKSRALAALDAALAKERERQKALEERRMAEAALKQEEEALALAANFCSRLLRRVASPELENRIVGLFLEDIGKLPEDKTRELSAGFRNHDEAGAEIKTTHPLSRSQQEALISALNRLVGEEVTCRFGEDPELLAGVRVAMGPLILGANLRDELAAFRSVSRLEP